jgi:predicted N-acetyltransferase YhbS
VDLRRLEPGDDRAPFSCGEPHLDTYLREHAGQAQFKHRASATYVLTEDSRVIGYVTVVPGTIRRDDLNNSFRRLPPGAMPVLILARMAVSTDYQRRGLGERLIIKVLSLALDMARDLGCVGVVVDAKSTARAFYDRYDFQWLPEQPRADAIRGFLPIRTIEAARVGSS